MSSLKETFPSAGERRAAVTLLIVMLVFRVINILMWRFDTDESQHTHVIWGWARGFVQYRDLCDNHMPLFQLLFAPIYALIGDRPTILFWMRFLLLPIYFATAWATYRIGTLLFSRRVGIWAVILVGLYPGYHFLSLEFRTDNLWSPLWLLCVVVLLTGPLTIPRAAAAGFLMGCCFGISMKTTLLFLSLGVAAVGTCFLYLSRGGKLPWPHLARCGAAFLFPAFLIPGGIIGGFAFAGIWPQFRFWVFENNLLPGFTNHPSWWVYLFPLLFPLIVASIWFYTRRISDETTALRRGFVLLICGFYVPALWSYWNLVSRQDYLPLHPLAFVAYSGSIIALTDRFFRERLPSFFGYLPIPALIGAAELVVCLESRPFWKDYAKTETDLLRATYRLTDPGNFVLDEKGETVFRQRCFAPVLEPLYAERIRRGLVVDDAAQRCVETHTCVATKGRDMTPGTLKFIDQNYLPVGSSLYVAGAFLKAAPGENRRFFFHVTIPTSYEIISPRQPVSGMLDGSPYLGARQLSPGAHTFVETSAQAELALLWSQAVYRNFTPFH